jgi:hypothetical protein
VVATAYGESRFLRGKSKTDASASEVVALHMARFISREEGAI